MEQITKFFASVGINFDSFWKAALILLVGTLLMSLFGRFIFGKKSALHNAVSSAVGILFIYIATVVLESAGAEFSAFIAPLPYVTISGEKLVLFSFSAHYTTVCTEILSMIILAFLVNIADRWLPAGKNLFSWIFFRALTVVIGYLMHLLVVWLFGAFLPEGLVVYAPTVLLGLLILLILTGALKIVVGAILSTVNPIIGGLYTFFFANVIGKQITKAVLTTAILTGIVLALRYFGVDAISISGSALVAYLPFLIILLAIWFIAGKLL